jgi:hypothetical protein
MAIFPLIAWQAWRHHAESIRHCIRRLVILLSILGNGDIADIQSKRFSCPPRVILIASYLQQTTSADYLLPPLSEVMELNHCNATRCKVTSLSR